MDRGQMQPPPRSHHKPLYVLTLLYQLIGAFATECWH